MSDTLAVDVVLLPPPEIMDKIISLCSHLSDSPTRLNKSDCFPHISLAMGVLKQADIIKATDVLKNLAKHFTPQNVILLKTNYYDTPDSQQLSELTVKSSAGIINLHLSAMEAFRPLLSHDDVQASMFIQRPPVASLSTYWVKHYYDKRGANDFYPHITLGDGKAKPLDLPVDFAANRLALCHLGTYCTCRKILAEVDLR
jgi:hypothetical protein